jgi:hypothetical protein
MGSLLPKLLLALTLLLPGGFIVAPVLVVVKRWRDRRAAQAIQLPATAPEPRPIAHSQAPA